MVVRFYDDMGNRWILDTQAVYFFQTADTRFEVSFFAGNFSFASRLLNAAEFIEIQNKISLHEEISYKFGIRRTHH